jgi:hypothetical protein
MSDDGSSVATTKYPIFIRSSSLHITKLTRTNYNLWHAQIIPYLRGQGVFGFIDGTLPPPSKILITAAGKTEENTDYEDELAAWTKTDQMILSTITSSLSDEVLLQVYTATTSAAIWTALQTSFASQSRAKLVHLRTQLASTRKNELTAAEYYFQLKNIADELHLAGHPLPPDDFVAYLLAGLGPEYDSLVTHISTRDTITVDELYALLLTTEARLNNHKPLAVGTPPPANTVHALYSRNSVPSQSSPPQGNSNRGRGNSTNYRGRGNRGNRYGRGNGAPRQNYGNNSSITCQICAKTGHTAHACYYRYEQSSNPAAASQPPRNPRPSQAYASNPTSNRNTDWLPDTGASHHITNDFRNLNITSEPYDGTDQIHVGDGSGLFGNHSA